MRDADLGMASTLKYFIGRNETDKKRCENLYCKSPFFPKISSELQTLDWIRNKFIAKVKTGTHSAVDVHHTGVCSDTSLEIKFSTKKYLLILEHCTK